MISTLDPVEAAARVGGRRGRVLLHSGRDDDGCGRFSFVACEPRLELRAWGRDVEVRVVGEVAERFESDPLEALERFAHQNGFHRPAERPEPIAFGYLSYDLGRSIERLGAGPAAGADCPDLWFGFYGAVWRYDRVGGRAEIVGSDVIARQRLADALRGPAPAPTALRLGALRPDDGADEYRRRVERIREYIHAGDVYQVNLARRLVAPIERDGDALSVYRALLERSPSGFGALVEAGEVRLISGSPERYLAREPGSGRLETRPIKGTRERTGELERDARLAAELAADEKERAEHLMIVDLERNDLGRVAELGSVRVDRLGYIVELPTLFHMVSTVSCRVRRDAGLADILRATFPGGSITGAPKIRAMEIIDELEPARRGPYTGAIGYLGGGGALDLSIAIRTLTLTAGEARLHVGGGIVADSTPERELEETEEKAAAWRAALRGLAEGAVE